MTGRCVQEDLTGTLSSKDCSRAEFWPPDTDSFLQRNTSHSKQHTVHLIQVTLKPVAVPRRTAPPRNTTTTYAAVASAPEKKLSQAVCPAANTGPKAVRATQVRVGVTQLTG